jgi:hypothetical protein
MIPRDTRIQSVGKVCANLLHRATQDKLWRIFMSWLKKIFGRSHKKSIGAKKSEQINLRQSQEKKVLPQKSTEPSSIGVWKKLKQKMDERHIKRCPNIGHEKSKH